MISILIEVLVVDDHKLFAEGTVALLSFEPRIVTVGIAKDGITCLSLISKTKPNVVLLDINLPDICGVDLIDKIIQLQPETKIIMLTGQNPQDYITKSRNKGANGFLIKECSAKDLIQAIIKVYEGDVFFLHGLEAFLHPGNSSDNDNYLVKSETPSEILTTREIEIIELLSRGFHNKEIALILSIKVRTVNFHVSNILLKLGVSTRIEAALQWANIYKKN
jgi:Response regulator containing a CheY-like receiver domain and an HTH DNA-binding domain